MMLGSRATDDMADFFDDVLNLVFGYDIFAGWGMDLMGLFLFFGKPAGASFEFALHSQKLNHVLGIESHFSLMLERFFEVIDYLLLSVCG
jgi:hypothetical protein